MGPGTNNAEGEEARAFLTNLLQVGCVFGKLYVVQFAVEQGAKLTVHNLMAACDHNHVPLARWIVEQGVLWELPGSDDESKPQFAQGQQQVADDMMVY